MVASAPTDRHDAQIVMVIDNLEPGGAQRQFCLLATSLRRVGFRVKVIVFRQDPFFEDTLRHPWHIPITHIKARNRIQLFFRLRGTLRREMPEVVVSFLSWPNLLVELSGLPRRSFAVIVSERNLDTAGRGLRRYLRYFFHRFADAVVCNSYAQKELIAQIAGHLDPHTIVIVNGVDTNYFRPSVISPMRCSDRLRILVLARFVPQKNVLRFVEGLHLIRVRHPKLAFLVEWYGKRPTTEDHQDLLWGHRSRRSAVAYYRSVVDAIAERALGDCIQLHDPCDNVVRLYATTDVVCLPSIYEGCSNVICEAMSCGVPVLASDVSDNVRLVKNGRNGFLFDPLSADDIAETIVRFGRLPIMARRRQGQEGRRVAEATLSYETLLSRYVELIIGMGRSRCHREGSIQTRK